MQPLWGFTPIIPGWPTAKGRHFGRGQPLELGQEIKEINFTY